jgi:hypothetical protein
VSASAIGCLTIFPLLKFTRSSMVLMTDSSRRCVAVYHPRCAPTTSPRGVY